jgi:hypothetical protein
MATFEATQGMRNQRHFEVLEIDLPVITGACTIGAAQGTGTPLTCDQAWTSEYKTYYFTNTDAPILPSISGEPIHRLIMSIKETSTELKPGDGLSSRSSLSVVLKDVTKQDPNIGAPGVTDAVKNQGTYLGKLSARQIFENKDCRLKLYRVESDGSIDLANGAQTRSFLTDTLSLNKNGTWNVACKDVLSLVNLGEKSWPLTQGGFLRQDINDSTTTIPVDEFVDWSSVFAVRIGDEHLEVTSVTGNLTNAATLNTTARGSQILAPVSNNLLTNTIADDHSGGDEVFICELSDNETIDSLLTRILVDSDFPVGLIPATEWADEVAEWHATDKISTLHSESESVNDVINRILTGFLMDLWFSVTENKARLSAISVWKQSTTTLVEGKEINARSIKKIAKEPLRATRALILYDKRNLSDSDDTASFKKGSQFSDNTLIGPELFTKHKDKLFENNHLISKNAADLLTQRYVSRFKFTPFERPFTVDEKYLTFKTGDVVDLATTVDQGIYGLPSGNIRAQITKINPKYKGGRTYEVKALTYEAAFNTGSEIVLDSPLGSVNLYILAGAPSEAVDLTFVLDGSYSFGNVSIGAGAFKSGSKLIIIMVNGFDGQATGGKGGRGDSIVYDEEGDTLDVTLAFNGQNAGVVYDAQGVDTDIYFSGATTSTAFPVADGFMRAPSGGDGGFAFTGVGINAVSGNGGDGGDGRNPGSGGDSGIAAGGGNVTRGTAGSNGQIDGSSSGWGNAGANNNAIGGNAGAGVIDSGATVVLFGTTAARYINGIGDHP